MILVKQKKKALWIVKYVKVRVQYVCYVFKNNYKHNINIISIFQTFHGRQKLGYRKSYKFNRRQEEGNEEVGKKGDELNTTWDVLVRV